MTKSQVLQFGMHPDCDIETSLWDSPGAHDPFSQWLPASGSRNVLFFSFLLSLSLVIVQGVLGENAAFCPWLPPLNKLYKFSILKILIKMGNFLPNSASENLDLDVSQTESYQRHTMRMIFWMGEEIAKSDLILGSEWQRMMHLLHRGGECMAWSPSPPVHLPVTESGAHSWKTENKAEGFRGSIRERLLLFSPRWILASKTLGHLLQTVHLRKVGRDQCLQKPHWLEPLQTQPACFAQPVGQQHCFQRLLLLIKRPRTAECRQKEWSGNGFHHRHCGGKFPNLRKDKCRLDDTGKIIS